VGTHWAHAGHRPALGFFHSVLGSTGRQMRVLHSIHSGGFYGAERVVYDLIDVQASDSRSFPSLLDFVDPGEDESTLGSKIRTAGNPVFSFTVGRGATPRALLRYSALLKRLRPALVHSHGYKPTFFHLFTRALGLHDVPLVVTAHGYSRKSKALGARLYRKLDLALLGRADSLVTVSSEMKRYLTARNPQLSPKTILNGVNPNLRVRGERPLGQLFGGGQTGLAEGGDSQHRQVGPIIGSVGRLVDMKNHALLISAVSEIRDAHPCSLVIIGDGPLRQSLEAQWRMLMPDTEPALVAFQSNILEWMAGFDLFCMPSRDGEGLPIALLEAGLLGRAVVCSDSGGMAELVKHGENGLLFRKEEKEELKACLIRLVSDAQAREDFGKALSSRVRSEYDIRITGEAYASEYELVLNRRRPKPDS